MICKIGELIIVNSKEIAAVQTEMNQSLTMKCKKGNNHTDGDNIRTCTVMGSSNGDTLNCSSKYLFILCYLFCLDFVILDGLTDKTAMHLTDS